MSTLLDTATQLLSIEVTPQEIIDIPPYYDDPEANEAASKNVGDQTAAAFTLALAYKLTNDKVYRNKAAEIIRGWSLVTKEAANNDGKLDLPLKFQRFIAAADFMGYYWEGRIDFVDWLIDVYTHACTDIVGRTNNWGAIGLAGLIHAHSYLESSIVDRDLQTLKDKISFMILSKNNIFGKKGELWQENLRNNSGLWYYYFTLGPLLKSCWLLRDKENLYPLIGPTIEVFYRYVCDPTTWPYEKATIWPFSAIQHILWPSEDTFQVVGPNDVLLVAGHLYNNPAWTAKGQDVASGSNYWMWAQELIDNNLV